MFSEYINQKLVTRRKQREAKRNVNQISQVVEELINELKQHNDWKRIPIGNVIEQYNIPVLNRYRLIYELESNSNIISRPAQQSKIENEIAHTVPFEYKYVSKKEKEDLNCNANCFRKIIGERKTFVIERFSKYKTDLSLYDRLIVLNTLYSYNVDKKFVKLSLAKLLNEIGIDIEKFAQVIDYLQECKLLVVKNIEYQKNGLTFICKITKNENGFWLLSKLELKNTIKMISDNTNPVKTKPRNKEKVNPPPKSISIDECKKLLTKLSQENLDLRDEVKILEKREEQYKEKEKKLNEFNDEYQGYCFDCLTDFLGNTINSIRNEITTHPEHEQYLRKLNKSILDLSSDFSNKLINYSK